MQSPAPWEVNPKQQGSMGLWVRWQLCPAHPMVNKLSISQRDAIAGKAAKCILFWISKEWPADQGELVRPHLESKVQFGAFIGAGRSAVSGRDAPVPGQLPHHSPNPKDVDGLRPHNGL